MKPNSTLDQSREFFSLLFKGLCSRQTDLIKRDFSLLNKAFSLGIRSGGLVEISEQLSRNGIRRFWGLQGGLICLGQVERAIEIMRSPSKLFHHVWSRSRDGTLGQCPVGPDQESGVRGGAHGRDDALLTGPLQPGK